MTPSEFKELPVPYCKIEKEDVAFLNQMFREKRETEEIVAFVNSRTLADIEKDTIEKLEKIRKSLVKRRCQKRNQQGRI